MDNILGDIARFKAVSHKGGRKYCHADELEEVKSQHDKLVAARLTLRTTVCPSQIPAKFLKRWELGL